MKAVAYLAENLGGYDDPAISLHEVMHQSGHNIGNFAFWNATRTLFEAEVRCFPFGAGTSKVADDVDCIVIPAANFLNQSADLGWLADLIAELDKPCMVVGLGAQSEHEDQIPELKSGTVRFLNEVSQRTPFVGVRGDFTKEVCAKYGVGNVRVLGCPSILTNGDRELGMKIASQWNKPIEKLAIHASSIKAHVRQAERFLFKMLDACPGSTFLIQRPVELMKVVRGLPLNDDECAYVDRIHCFLAPDVSMETFRYILRRSGFLPYSVDSWRFMLASHTHSIGTRIHGAIISISSYLPSICVTHDTRTRELCSAMSIPSLPCEMVGRSQSVRDLFESRNFDASLFEQTRSELANGYANLVRMLGLEISPFLRRNFL